MQARRALLTLHIGSAVGWMGAILAYLPFDLASARAADEATLRAAYLAMATIAQWAILPLAVLGFATGIAVSLTTPWGLFRHYWVVLSLALTAIALLVLLLELGTIRAYAAVAADPAATAEDLRALGHSLPHSVGGLVVLTGVLILNVHKPKGLTRYGWRRQREA